MRNYLIALTVILGLYSCQGNESKQSTDKATQSIASDLAIDHFNIWVENPTKAKAKLTELGFISVPDSLSRIHYGQGTAGRYFYFLNNYLELIFVYNENELKENTVQNPQLDFAERAAFTNNGVSPFSIALKVKGYSIEKIPFEKVKYHQEWMEENANIYSAKSSKTNLQEPSVFVVYPEIESDRFETMEDLVKIPEEYALWREFFKHPNGAKKVTRITITSTNLDLSSSTMRALNGIENLTIESGKEHLMELYFDQKIQGKTYDLRPDLPLIIHL